MAHKCCGSNYFEEEFDLKRHSQGKHLCGIFQSPEEHSEAVTDFFIDGLRNNHKIYYFWSVHHPDELCEKLQKRCLEMNINFDAAMKKKQLEFSSAKEVYLGNGYFSPDETISRLQALFNRAMNDEGYEWVRVTGEMCWSVGMYPGDNKAASAPQGSDRLIEYEARLACFFESNNCVGLCQYEASYFQPSVIVSMLDSHPTALIGNEEFDNFYYLPPEDLLLPDTSPSILKYRIKNLKARKKVEERLKERTQQLLIANENIQKEVAEREKMAIAKESAERLSRAKSDFLAVMSHEIRTPLNGIICTTNFISDTPLSIEQKEYLEVIKVSSDHLMVVLNDVLDWSKIESGKLILEEKPFCLRRCIKGVVDMFKGSEKDIKITHSIASDVPSNLLGDITRLRQILFNLLSNAVKFTPEGGNISIAVEKCEEPDDNGIPDSYSIHFCVTDTGIGIPKEKCGIIFSAFTQVDSSITRKYGGTGLGLAISKKMVEMMHGKIWFESEVNVGSTFHFTIQTKVGPNEEVRGIARGNSGILSKRKKCDSALNRQLRVLIAEDNLINQKIVKRMFDKLGYLNAVYVTNGQQAIDQVTKENFDVVFMDLQMPEMDGLEATRIITSLDWKARNRPIIIAMTASALQADKAACYTAGMDFHISKPLKMESIQKVLHKLETGKRLKKSF